MNSLPIFIFSLVAPLLLLPIEAVLPYPFIIEECVKAGIAWVICTRLKNHLLKISMGAALLFSLSETFFYLTNFFTSGTLSGFFLRIGFTTSFHIITMVLFVLAGEGKPIRTLFILPLAIILHFLYNLFVVHL